MPLLAVVLVLLLQTSSVDTGSRRTSAADILELRTQRTSLENRKAELENQLRELREMLQDRQTRDATQAAIEKTTPGSPERASLQRKFELYNEKRSWHAGNAVQALREAIDEAEGELKKTTHALSLNDRDLERRTTVESGRLRLLITASIVFGLLMAVMIAGFSAVLYRDPAVRGQIFQGPVILQLMALVAIFVALILFGLTGILDGTQLSGLIGGLTGYIVGHLTGGKKK